MRDGVELATHTDTEKSRPAGDGDVRLCLAATARFVSWSRKLAAWKKDCALFLAAFPKELAPPARFPVLFGSAAAAAAANSEGGKRSSCGVLAALDRSYSEYLPIASDWLSHFRASRFASTFANSCWPLIGSHSTQLYKSGRARSSRHHSSRIRAARRYIPRSHWATSTPTSSAAWSPATPPIWSGRSSWCSSAPPSTLAGRTTT